MISARTMSRSAAALPLAAAMLAAAWVGSLGRAPTGAKLDTSHTVVSRDGKLLRAYATGEGRWRLPASPDDVDPRYLRLLTAYEDKRFASHFGVDLWAISRAAFQFAMNGHVVSGGSTLTMQVA
ncbi:MAG: transglycosylase domain-containing protein, partial [Pseudolabrys sp.]|nr:transglycosylase domain-containing protein [Pseudolabrys sp.]